MSEQALTNYRWVESLAAVLSELLIDWCLLGGW
jgi:hypothetical protein